VTTPKAAASRLSAELSRTCWRRIGGRPSSTVSSCRLARSVVERSTSTAITWSSPDAGTTPSNARCEHRSPRDDRMTRRARGSRRQRSDSASTKRRATGSGEVTRLTSIGVCPFDGKTPCCDAMFYVADRRAFSQTVRPPWARRVRTPIRAAGGAPVRPTCLARTAKRAKARLRVASRRGGRG
jgi:hypothetical protein